MIASRDPQQPRFLHLLRTRIAPRGAIALAWLLVGLLTACANGRQTTLLRSSRARAVGELRAEREQQERELALWQKTREEALEETARLRFEAVRAGSVLRTVRAELGRELDALKLGEQGLVDAKRRAAEIEVELQPLRALEQQVEEQQAAIAAAKQRVQALAAEVEKAGAAAAKQEATLRPKLDALQKRLAALQAVGVTIAEVEAKVAAAQQVLAPSAAKKPAASPKK